jgi:endogenous inhibitor of DNA gyrase (YacG/DUF329 family)
MDCLNCKKEVLQTPGKRERQFCNSTCRSNFWQKAKRKVAQNNKPGNKKRLQKERNTVSQAAAKHSNPLTPDACVKPKNLDELKALCPFEAGTDERRVWVAEERQKYGI